MVDSSIPSIIYQNKQMQSIVIKTVNHDNFEDLLTIQIHKTATIEEIFNKYIQKLAEQESTEMPKFQQVAVCGKNDPEKRLQGNTIPDDSSQLVVIHPKSNCPIIECKVADSYYLIYDYNKNDKLDRVLSRKNDLKNIISQKKIMQMSINGKSVNFTQKMYTPTKQFIEGRVNSIVEIVIEIEEENEMIEISIKEPLQLKLSFERVTGQGGKVEITQTVDRSKTIQQLLPSLIKFLKESDYDWQYNDYNHERDKQKITIFQINSDSTMSKISLNKPLRNIIGKQASISLAINRHYEGG